MWENRAAHMWAAGQIIPHSIPFVKGLLKIFFQRKKPSALEDLIRESEVPHRGGLLCSRHNPSFLQRNGTGPHLYSAHLHTVRSRSLSARSYIAHVGFGSSPLPRSLVSMIIISYFWRFVKRDFFADFSRSFFTRCTLITLLGAPCGGFPLDILIIPHLTLFVKGFFEIFLIFLCDFFAHLLQRV